MYTIVYMEDLLTVKQVAILLKVHHLTVRRYINQGKLKALKLAGNVRISQQELHSFTQIYIPQNKSLKASAPSATNTPSFSTNDSIFRLKGRGISINHLSK